jgi:hypothetical protein
VCCTYIKGSILIAVGIIAIIGLIDGEYWIRYTTGKSLDFWFCCCIALSGFFNTGIAFARILERATADHA